MVAAATAFPPLPGAKPAEAQPSPPCGAVSPSGASPAIAQEACAQHNTSIQHLITSGFAAWLEIKGCC